MSSSAVSAPWISPELASTLDQLSDAQIVIATAYAEARSEPADGLLGVVNIIKNRVAEARPQWGSTLRKVCLAPWQFSCWSEKGGKGNHEKLVALVTKMASKEPLTDPLVKEVAYLTHGVLDGFVRDNIKGATHYHVASMQPRPAWAVSETPVCQRGAHVFYKGVK